MLLASCGRCVSFAVIPEPLIQRPFVIQAAVTYWQVRFLLTVTSKTELSSQPSTWLAKRFGGFKPWCVPIWLVLQLSHFI